MRNLIPFGTVKENNKRKEYEISSLQAMIKHLVVRGRLETRTRHWAMLKITPNYLSNRKLTYDLHSVKIITERA